MALKVHVNTIQHNRELDIYEQLNKLGTRRLAKAHIRPLENSFQVQGPHGIHKVFVQPALGISLRDLQDKTPDGVLSLILTQLALKQSLSALDFLHTSANITHTGKSLSYRGKSLVTANVRKIFIPETCSLV